MNAQPSRRERLETILPLRAQGLTYRQIGERLGLKTRTVANLVNDPDGSKARAIKARHAGQCADCGYPTSGANGRAKAPTRCLYCAQGIPRPAAARPRLCVPVCLRDVPPEVRLDAARDASRIEKDEHERLEILLVALDPSDRTYWVSESARPMLERWAA